MNQDIFCFDIPNQNSNISAVINSETLNNVNDKNIELSNNQKNQFSQPINLFSINNYYFGNSLNNFKNESKTESDKENKKDEDKETKLNIDIYNTNNLNNNYLCQINNNIINNFDNNFIIKNNFNNNNISNCNCLCCNQIQYIPFIDKTNKVPYEDYFLSGSLIYDNNNQYNYNENNDFVNIINSNKMITFLYDNNNNIDISKIFDLNSNSDSELDYDLNINN